MTDLANDNPNTETPTIFKISLTFDYEEFENCQTAEEESFLCYCKKSELQPIIDSFHGYPYNIYIEEYIQPPQHTLNGAIKHIAKWIADFQKDPHY